MSDVFLLMLGRKEDVELFFIWKKYYIRILFYNFEVL
jgi:hypothetical protein